MILKKCGSDSGYFSKAHGNCFVRLNENMYWPVLYSRNELASTFLSQLDTVFHELNHFEQVLKMKSDKYVSYNNYIIIIEWLRKKLLHQIQYMKIIIGICYLKCKVDWLAKEELKN